MKITAIESLQWAEYPRLMVVRVHTEGGIIGLGETVDKIPGAKGALHGTIAPLVLGQDALDIEGLWRFVFDNIMYHGYAGAELRALSALELALWDIMGKVYDAPEDWDMLLTQRAKISGRLVLSEFTKEKLRDYK
jgi:L-alanine-DL-glutamate epimerase-like enolase superfamily enzyme